MGLLLSGIGIIIASVALIGMLLYATIRFEDWGDNE